jgi:hypothetical protein
MQRLAALFLVVLAACGASGAGTEAATLSGISPTIKSSFAQSFTGPDGGGTMVLGWTINFSDSGPGADCKSGDTHIVASIGIFTNQAAGSAKVATLDTGDVAIVAASPPTVQGNAAANMGAMGVSNILGNVSITAFSKNTGGDVIEIDGSVIAGGLDGNQSSVSIGGNFVASICD